MFESSEGAATRSNEWSRASLALTLRAAVFLIHVMMLLHLFSWMAGFGHEDLALRLCLGLMLIYMVAAMMGVRGREMQNISLSLPVWAVGIHLADRAGGADLLTASGVAMLITLPWLITPALGWIWFRTIPWFSGSERTMTSAGIFALLATSHDKLLRKPKP
ncbi:hypothetical protein ACEUZ9_005466 [Paracoccus litorisediminis]|uniref:hypothetical protein n=1 Tax=Paracoccus litorisediminis TaxID=2006130 RepID=UPI00372DCA7F